MQEATFPDWTMGFATVDRHVMAAIPGFADLFALDHQLRAEHADEAIVHTVPFARGAGEPTSIEDRK